MEIQLRLQLTTIALEHDGGDKVTVKLGDTALPATVALAEGGTMREAGKELLNLRKLVLKPKRQP